MGVVFTHANKEMTEVKTQAGKVDEIKKLLDADKCAREYFIHILKGLKDNSFTYINDHNYKRSAESSKVELLLLVFKEQEGSILKREEESTSEVPDDNMWISRVMTPEKMESFVSCKNPFYFVEGFKLPHISAMSIGKMMREKEGNELFSQRYYKQEYTEDGKQCADHNYLLTIEEATTLFSKF